MSDYITISMHPDDKEAFYVKAPYDKLAKIHRIGGKWMQSGKEWRFPIDNGIWQKFQEEFKDEMALGLVRKDLAFMVAMDRHEQELEKFVAFKRLAMKDEPTDFGVEGLGINGKNCLFNYQRWGIQCGLQVGDGMLIGDQPGLGKCILCNNIITFNNKIDRAASLIDSLDESGWYASSDGIGEWHEVSGVSVLGNSNGVDTYFPVKRVYRERVGSTAVLKTQSGLLNEFGLNHRFYTNHGWKRVCELNENDWIMCGDRIVPPNPAHYDIEDVYWLAWQIGEGYDYGNTTHSITNTDLSVLERIQRHVQSLRSRLFSLDAKEQFYNAVIKKDCRDNRKDRYILSFNHKYTEYLHDAFGYKMHTKSGDKEIPMSILNADDECVRVFVRALFDAEGCCNDGGIEILSKSYDIIEKMWYLLKRFGIFGIVSKKKVKGYEDETYWRMRIGGIYARMYRDEIGFDTQEKRDALEHLCQLTENTNIGYSSPCRHLMRRLVEDVLETSYNICNLNTYKMRRRQEYSVKKIREFVDHMEHIINNGVYRKKSKWSDLEDTFNRNRVARRDEAMGILSELKMYYTGAFQWLNVVSVEERGEGDYVYDFEVDDDSHNYYASGALTHNTIQAIGIAIERKNRGEIRNCLVICPASLKYNWLDEIHKFTNETALVIGHKAKNAEEREKQWIAEGYFFKIVNYELVARDLYADPKKADNRIKSWKYVLNNQELIILDEIQYCKHHNSQRTMSCRQFNAKYRIGLSGTPLDGRLEEIHSIFQILKPGLFMSKQKFMERYAEYDYFGAVKGYHRIKEVADKIEPYYIRRKKEDVLKDLPPKIFKDMHVQLSPKNMKAYRELVSRKNDITSEASAIELLIRARQFLDFPEILGMHNTSDKYLVFKELLDNLVKDNGQKVIVFSEYTNTLHWIYKNLETEYDNILVIDGSVGSEERQAIVNRFNNDDKCHIVLCSDAAAEGLNMQKAHAVVHYTDSYKPTKMQQRNDRAHRVTTDHGVTIYRFITDGTIEEHVREILARKQAVTNALLGEDCDEFSIENTTAMELIKCL